MRKRRSWGFTTCATKSPKICQGGGVATNQWAALVPRNLRGPLYKGREIQWLAQLPNDPEAVTRNYKPSSGTDPKLLTCCHWSDLSPAGNTTWNMFWEHTSWAMPLENIRYEFCTGCEQLSGLRLPHADHSCIVILQTKLSYITHLLPSHLSKLFQSHGWPGA